jgi:hypothetical protein
VTDRVHASVEDMEPSALEVARDDVAAQAERDELRASDDPVLPSAEGRHLHGGITRSIFSRIMRLNVGHVSHRSIAPGFVCRFDTRSQRFCAGAVASMLAP